MKFSFLLRPPRFACAGLTLTTRRSLVYELEQGGIRGEIYTFTAHSVNSSDYQGKAHLPAISLARLKLNLATPRAPDIRYLKYIH